MSLNCLVESPAQIPDSATLRERVATQQNDLPAQEYDSDVYKGDEGDAAHKQNPSSLSPDSPDPDGKPAFNMGIPKDSDNTSGTDQSILSKVRMTYLYTPMIKTVCPRLRDSASWSQWRASSRNLGPICYHLCNHITLENCTCISGISSISHNHTTGSEQRRQQLPPIEQLPQPRPPAAQQQQQRRRRRRSQSGALEKKSVFTRAYEDVRVARPNSAEVLMDE